MGMGIPTMESDPWVNGWQAGKYSQPAPLPAMEQFDEWLEGFKTGCAEVAELHLWRFRLSEYLIKAIGDIHAQAADLLFG
jgi:hypothetical protein